MLSLERTPVPLKLVQPAVTEPELQPIKLASNVESSGSFVNRCPQSQQVDIPEPSTSRVRAEDVMIPYSISMGLIIFAIFIISFIVVIVIHGVVHNTPILFKFFANIYLAIVSLTVFSY